MEFVYNDMSAQASMAQYINDCVDVPRIIKGCQGCKTMPSFGPARHSALTPLRFGVIILS